MQLMPPSESRQVTWYAVHEFVDPYLAGDRDWPIAGTPAWMRLADDDPIKMCSVLDAARQWALRNETEQEAAAQASADLSAAVDWSAIASYQRQQTEFYAENPDLRRRA